MARTLTLATVQMDANPAPTVERLARAERLVTEAAAAGAQLVVLPELFNLGYAYVEENFRRAEPEDGPTLTWLKRTATRLNLHLAGSLLLLDQDEIYNALFLCAPDGRSWRYDKHYPWGWERGYFRESDRITVAETALGAIGFLLCWDVAHAELWRRYAGRVDLMVLASCPPDFGNPVYRFSDGNELTADDLGPLFRRLQSEGPKIFQATVCQQTAWLGVPALNSTGCGQIQTPLPNGQLLMALLAPLAPRVLRYLPRARPLIGRYHLVPAGQIVAATGEPLARLTPTQGESFVQAQVTLPDRRPSPQGTQPVPPVSRVTYWLSDLLLPWVSVPLYRRGARQAWGATMAPPRPATRRWLALSGGVALLGFLLGTRLARRR